jgi:hypothetical protein
MRRSARPPQKHAAALLLLAAAAARAQDIDTTFAYATHDQDYLAITPRPRARVRACASPRVGGRCGERGRSASGTHARTC